MKKIVLFPLLSALFLTCSEGQPEVAPVEPAEPLKLSGYEVIFSGQTPDLPYVDIISGNGDYSLVYPKSMIVAGKRVPYPEYKSLFLLQIDEFDKVVINALWTDEQAVFYEGYAHGMLMVKDAKGERKIISITYYPCLSGVNGGHPDRDWEGPKDPGKDYWVNY